MVGRNRKSGLEARSGREKLMRRDAPHWARLGKGQQLGYRKGLNGGSWVARVTDRKTMKKIQEWLGHSDDASEADGIDILTYDQAAAKARAWFEELDRQKVEASRKPRTKNEMTVFDATGAYLDFLADERKGETQARQSLQKYLQKSHIGKIRVVDLTKEDVEKFRRDIAESPRGTRARPGLPSAKERRSKKRMDGTDAKHPPKGKGEIEAETMSSDDLAKLRKRQRKSTSNRVLTNLKAALNKLVAGDEGIDDRAWRHVAAYRNVDGVRTRYLELEEIPRLIEACPEGLRELVTAAILTGARYGELCGLRVKQVFPEQHSIRLDDSKITMAQVIPITSEASEFLSGQIKDLKKTDLVFIRPDGLPWGKSHVFRPMRKACEDAGIQPITFHELRHTFASHLIMAGAELTAVAQALGHKSTRMVEKHYGHLRQSWVQEQIDQHAPRFFSKPNDKIVEPPMIPFLLSKPKRMARIQYTDEGPIKTWQESDERGTTGDDAKLNQQ
ncbi:MAG: site-specific integrase [Nitrospira sp.]|nr:site-specific integrase [Nitrospira sp.]